MFIKILAALLGLLVLLTIVGFFLPSKIELRRSMKIHAPAEYAFEEVNNLDRWNEWSYWHTLDPKMKISYSDKRSGPGSYYAWESEEMGNGKLTITNSEPFKSIQADLDFMTQGTAKSWFDFEPDGDSTKVTMGFSTDFGYNPFMRWMGATLFPSEMNKAYDYNLAKIKSIAEAKPRFVSKITEENIGPITYVGIKHTMSPQDPNAVSKEIARMYTTLFKDLKNAKVQVTGPAFCVFPSFSPESMEMVCALPVEQNAKLPAKYRAMNIPAGKVVKGINIGSYANLQKTHDEINSYIHYKKYTEAAAPWEVYITDPMTEKDTSKWITEVYYPIQ